MPRPLTPLYVLRLADDRQRGPLGALCDTCLPRPHHGLVQRRQEVAVVLCRRRGRVLWRGPMPLAA